MLLALIVVIMGINFLYLYDSLYQIWMTRVVWQRNKTVFDSRIVYFKHIAINVIVGIAPPLLTIVLAIYYIITENL